MIMKRRVLAAVTILNLFYGCASSFGSDHVCDKVTTESAGLSGTVEIKGKCSLTLTNITGRISILGILNNSSCDSITRLTLNNAPYCVNANATDTIIDIDDNQLVIIAEAEEVFPSVIEYYHVFEIADDNSIHSINYDIDEPMYYAAVISSNGYPQAEIKRHRRMFLNKMPVGAYITYTLLTPGERSFRGAQHIHIDEFNTGGYINDFDLNLSSPLSLEHSVRSEIRVYSRSAEATNPVFLLKYTVVTCDMKAVPAIPHAYATNPSNGGSLILPGNFSMIYSCMPGYELENPNNSAATCEYQFKNRTGRKNSHRHQLVTPIWKNYEAIRCVKEVISTGNVAIIVVSVIVSVILIAVAALYAAKKYKEKSNFSEPEQRLTKMRRNVVKDSPVSKDTSSKLIQENVVGAWQQAMDITAEATNAGTVPQITAGLKQEGQGIEPKRKGKKRSHKSSSKMISGTEVKGLSGSKITA